MYSNGFSLIKNRPITVEEVLSSAGSSKGTAAQSMRSLRKVHMTVIGTTGAAPISARQRKTTAVPETRRRGSQCLALARRESKEPEVYYAGPAKTDNSGQFGPRDHIAFRYEVRQVIGEGTFSQVLAAIDHKTGTRVAVKVLKDLDATYSHSLREIEILEGLQRAFKEENRCVELLESFAFRGHKVMVLPLYHRTLRAALPELSLPLITSVLQQLVAALAQVHSKNIIHSDLKPDNIMFTSARQDTVKIIDFGSACSGKELLFQRIQSRYYRAPEVILGCKYTTAVDMWSLGCIAVELLTNYPPFVGKNEKQQIYSMVQACGLPPVELLRHASRAKEFFCSRHQLRFPFADSAEVWTANLGQLAGVSAELHDFVMSCFEWLPSRRLTAARALTHALFQESRSNTSTK